jgi:hypothetical protein
MAFSPSSFLSRSPLFPFSSPLHRSRLGTIGVSACVPPSLSSGALALARLLCSPTSLISKPAMFEPTHPPTIGRREKACGPKARGHEQGVLFCFICFTLFFLFFYWNPVLSHRFLLRGLIPARGMGWLRVPLDGYFLCFWTVGALGCARRQCVQDLYE